MPGERDHDVERVALAEASPVPSGRDHAVERFESAEAFPAPSGRDHDVGRGVSAEDSGNAHLLRFYGWHRGKLETHMLLFYPSSFIPVLEQWRLNAHQVRAASPERSLYDAWRWAWDTIVGSFRFGGPRAARTDACTLLKTVRARVGGMAG